MVNSENYDGHCGVYCPHLYQIEHSLIKWFKFYFASLFHRNITQDKSVWYVGKKKQNIDEIMKNKLLIVSITDKENTVLSLLRKLSDKYPWFQTELESNQ